MNELRSVYSNGEECKPLLNLEQHPRIRGTLEVIKNLLIDEAKSNKDLDISPKELRSTKVLWENRVGGVGFGWESWHPEKYGASRQNALTRDAYITSHAGVMVLFKDSKNVVGEDLGKNETVKVIVYSSAVGSEYINSKKNLLNKSYGREMNVYPEEFAESSWLKDELRKQIKIGLPLALLDSDSAELYLERDGIPATAESNAVFINTPINK